MMLLFLPIKQATLARKSTQLIAFPSVVELLGGMDINKARELEESKNRIANIKYTVVRPSKLSQTNNNVETTTMNAAEASLFDEESVAFDFVVDDDHAL